MSINDAVTNKHSTTNTELSASVIVSLGRLFADVAIELARLAGVWLGGPASNRPIVSVSMNTVMRMFAIFIKMKKFDEYEYVRSKRGLADRYCSRPPCCWSAP